MEKEEVWMIMAELASEELEVPPWYPSVVFLIATSANLRTKIKTGRAKRGFVHIVWGTGTLDQLKLFNSSLCFRIDKSLALTCGNRKSVVICTEAQEQEQGRKPDTDSKEGCNLGESEHI